VSGASHAIGYTGKYYQLGQVSEFVLPGAVRIASTSTVTYTSLGGAFRPSPGIDNVAFVNPDGSKVLVATNTSETPQRFIVTWHGGAFRYILPSRGIVTFTWR
jgi:glucosylceramidase